MQKQNLFFKKFQKRFISFNDSIESYFNQLKNLKKLKIDKNGKIILIFGGTVILFLAYFLTPTFYDKQDIRNQIKTQIIKKYNFDVLFGEDISYGLLPKPHFFAKDVVIVNDKRNIAEVKDFKIYLSINELISDNFEIKDLVLNKANFKINKNDVNFFTDLLKVEPNENNVLIKNSKIFFENEREEILFINKISKSKFYYDFKKFTNAVNSKNEIFNIPFKFLAENDKFNKEIFTKFYSKKIRLDLETEISYNNEIKEGILDISLINDNSSLDYEIGNNYLKFLSKNKNNIYSGQMDFKPFYFTANFNYEGISTKDILNKNSIIYDVLESQLFNNLNLNIDINFNIKDIVNINELNNLFLKVGVEEGEINLDNSQIYWKDDLIINFKKGFFSSNNEDTNLIGKILIEVKNKDDFYSSYQVNKNFRKDINEIEFDFVYSLSQNKFSFDNVRVNKVNNENVDEFINNFNSNQDRVFNKVKFKNFVNGFFKVYAG